MPRRNLVWLLALSVVGLACYHKAQRGRYAHTFANAMALVERRALEPVAGQQLFEGAMQGMMSRLGDPYSAYIPPADFQRFNEVLDQQFEGVGMEVWLDPETKQLTVGSPIVGSPAYRAGVRAGDRILKIDQRATHGLALEEAVKLIRGRKGESVKVTVLHEGEKEPVELTLVRDTVRVDSVVGDRRNADGSWNYFLEGHEGLGYLRVNTFGERTVGELQTALDAMTKQGLRGLALDLRDDPGGLLESAIGVCDLFLDEGLIVTTRGRREDQIDRAYRASGKGRFLDFPMAVIVNHDSASASEVVAACLQDHGRAVVVGERTFGKGTVQEVVDFGEGRGAVRLTVRSYWRPSNQNIHRRRGASDDEAWGVLPDEGYAVSVSADDRMKLRLARLQRDSQRLRANGNGAPANGPPAEVIADVQLEQAVAYLLKKLATPQQ
jgi:carboxyl-terminal processing protease